MIKNALISVSDKSGLDLFAQKLVQAGIKLISTGGTAAAMRKNGLEVEDVSEITQFAEIMDGRVKTLHPHIHAGLLARDGHAEDQATLKSFSIDAIDLVVVNLYPFQKTVRAGAEPAEVIENIDIGGPSMIRAAAKNHGRVLVICDPDDYDRVAEAILNDQVTLELRRDMASKAFSHTAYYDTHIAAWFSGEAQKRDSEKAIWPAHYHLPLKLKDQMRYGENPHQKAAWYAIDGLDDFQGLSGAELLQGKQLSYNNLLDSDAALRLNLEVKDQPFAVIIKHATPCGAAIGANITEAFAKAKQCDPVSTFGGIVALNREIDGEVAEALSSLFLEVIIAPSFNADGLKILAEKKNLRLLLIDGLRAEDSKGKHSYRTLLGGVLIQEEDNISSTIDFDHPATKRAPLPQERIDMILAWAVVKHVKSNAIVLVRDGMTIGIGGGQTNRRDAVKNAIAQAHEHQEKGSADSVLASDAFFPFADGLTAAIDAGVQAVIQPGGAQRDQEIIDVADQSDIAMIMTGNRHFRH